MDTAFMSYAVQALRDYKLVGGDPAAGDAVGRIKRDRISTLIRQLSEIGLLDKPVTVEEVLDAQFFPPEAAK
jgi:hypothetical protein